MADGTNSPEQGGTPAYQQELIEYEDKRLAMRFKGDLGSEIDFQKFPRSYNPVLSSADGIVTAASEKDYFITHDHQGDVYIIDVAATTDLGKLVATRYEQDVPQVPSVKFGKPWEVPGIDKTAAVRELIVSKGAVRIAEAQGGRQINKPDPFSKYKALVLKYKPDFGR